PRDLPVITVEGEDDVAAVCGKMDSRSEQQIVLYLKRNQAFRDPLSFNRVRRHAYLTGKEALVVSPYQPVRVMADSAGMPAFSTVREAERWSGGSGRLTLFGQTLELRWLSQRVLIAGTAVVLLGLVAISAAALLVPSAEITIRPELTPVDVQSFEVTADLDAEGVDIEDGLLPARVAERDITVELAIETTGSGFVGDQPATGIVTLFNNSDEEVTVPAGLQVQTLDGVVFQTTEEVELPTGQDPFRPAEVVAVEPGEGGNVDVQTISEVIGGLAGDIDVLNNEPMSGGTNREARLVTQEDVNRLRGLVGQVIEQRGTETLNETFAEDSDDPRLIVDGTFDSLILSTEVSPQPDEEGDFVFATTVARVSALTVAFEDIQAYAAAELEEGQDEGLSISPDTVIFDILAIGEISETLSTVDFSFQASAMAGPSVNDEDIKEIVSGRSPDDAREALADAYALQEPADIEVTPGFVDWVSDFDFRVDVDVESEP
ncbi:MAG TPA: baseplate J/gp47 family protein, partial [Dehalococcoidia bacterium]|nr:baseplate J/gp47 family protein [Dehalococcoidia bacterium]